jgi:hypothetical protein
MEYPQDISLSGVKTIIVPFAYNSPWATPIPADTIALLEQAAAEGTKIIILGMPGTVSSDFDALLQSPNVTVLTDNLVYGVTPTARADILSAVTSALGSDRPTYLNAYGHDVELSMMQDAGNNGDLLLVTNWEPNAVTVDVGVNVPAGHLYTLLERDVSGGVTQVEIDGQTDLTSADLQNFRLTLAPNDSRIFFVQEAS